MNLCIDARFVTAPTASDIEEALGAKIFPKGWLIALEDGDAFLDATMKPDGSFTVTHSDGTTSHKGRADAAAVKAAFVKYLRGDASWRKEIRWDRPANPSGKPTFVKDNSPLIGRDGSGPPPWAIVAMVVVIGFVVLMFSWPEIAYTLFPFAHSGWFWPVLIFLPMAALILFAVVSKGLDFRRAASWETTTGYIVSSKIAQRHSKFQGEPERIENYAAVIYEFKTPNGRTVQGSRIGIGDDNRGADAAPTVKRYPAGTDVTVYYDPTDPRNCVLERGGPKGIQPKGCVLALIELSVAGGIIWAWIMHGPGVVKALFPNAAEGAVALASGIGVFLCMLAYAQWRMSKAAKAWPTAAGMVVRSEICEERENISNTRTTLYRPTIEYAYTVGGLEYRSAQIQLNVAMSGSKTWADRVMGKYPEGSSVNVLYDPDNPTNAVLENPGIVSWYPLALAAGAFAFAVWQTHVFG